MDLTFPDIYGADRGFNVRNGVLTQTADGIPLNDIWTEFQSALAEWNKNRSVFQALFTFNTTDAFGLVPTQTATGITFEKASEFGLAKSGRAKPDYLKMGYGFDWFDLSLRYTRSFLREASYEQVQAQHVSIQEADNRLIFSAVMSALTTKPVDAPSRLVSPEGITIYGLWDGLGDVPETYGGKTFSGSHNHYLVSGAATVDGGDLKEQIDHIQEHGYGLRSSNEQIVIFVHPTQFETIRTFRAGVNGSPYDFVPSTSAPAFLSPVDIVGDKAPATYNGLAIEGSYGDAWITKDYQVPLGYLIAVASSGTGSARNPVAFRQFPRAESQGLNIISENQGYPLVGASYERGFGVGVRHRSAAVVTQIKASGTYDNPVWPTT